MALYLRQIPLGPMQNFVYLVGRTDRPETAVIDAAWDVNEILRIAREDGRTITHALATHRHFDHTNGLDPLLEKQSVTVVAHRDDAQFMSSDIPASAITTVGSGDVIDVGGLPIRCVHTPGHTPGSQCFLFNEGEGGLVSGDCLFVNACGRCDFEESDPAQMYDSLHRVLGALPAETKLFPGHDYGDVRVSSLERERARNPYLRVGDVDAFLRLRMG